MILKGQLVQAGLFELIPHSLLKMAISYEKNSPAAQIFI